VPTVGVLTFVIQLPFLGSILPTSLFLDLNAYYPQPMFVLFDLNQKIVAQKLL
jgi:hypothetical protein